MRFLSIVLIIGILLSSTPGLSRAEGLDPVEVKPYYISLSLNEVLGIALLNNFDVQLAFYDRYINQQDIDEAKSIYDTVLKLTADYEYDKSAKPTTILGSVSHTGSVGAEVSKKFITGTDVTVSYDLTRESTDSAFATLNPYYESELAVTFTQPLLRNFFGMEDWGNVRITKIDVKNYSSEVLDRIEKHLADVEIAFWDVVVALKLVEIGEDMYKQANEFYEINIRKSKLGTSEPTDLFAAEANRELRASELELERNNLRNAIGALKLLINHPNTQKDILPVAALDIEETIFSLIPSLKTAFVNRRDYKRAKNAIKAKKIKFDMKRNARWPQLDLEGSLKLNGVDRMPKGAADDSFSDKNPDYYGKATFSFPFEDRSARSEYNKAKGEKAKALISLKKTEKAIVREVDDSVRKVNVYRERVNKNRIVEEIQKKKLNEEMTQFGYGRSDSDRIIRFQEDYLNAMVRTLRSIREYKRALIELYLTEDTFLTRRGLAVK